MIYQLRAVIYEYGNITMYKTNRSRLLKVFETKEEAQKSLEIAKLGHYKGKYIYQYIRGLKNGNEIAKRLDEYLKTKMGLNTRISEIHEEWDLTFKIPELSQEYLKKIHKIVGINFCFIEQKEMEGKFVFEWCIGGDDEDYWWLDRMKYNTHEEATNDAIIIILDWFLSLNSYEPESILLPQISGDLEEISSVPSTLNLFLNTSQYFYLEDSQIKIKNTIKRLGKNRRFDFTGEDDIQVIDFKQEVKKECKELLGLLKNHLFELKQI